MKKYMLCGIFGYLSLVGCGSSNDEPAGQIQPVNQNQPIPSDTVQIKQPAPKEIKKTNDYAGSFFGEDIDGTLTFEKDKSVRGKFFSVQSNSVYRLMGSNYIDGVIKAEMIVGADSYYGTLRKTLSDRYIIWSGEFQHGHNTDEEGNLLPGGEYFEIRRLR